MSIDELPPEPLAPDYQDLIEALNDYTAALELLRQRYTSALEIDQLPTIALGLVLAAKLASLEGTLQYLREDMNESLSLLLRE